MKIFIGSDHAGLAQKERIIESLSGSGHEVVDFGTNEYDEQDDYPDFIAPVAKEVSKDPDNVKGIILGGSGQGEAIVANRFPRVRAVVFYGNKTCLTTPTTNLELTRQHNDANILALGSRFITDDEAVEAVDLWLDTPFSNGERHKRRIDKIERVHD
jgi:ribose 5-phosphate isomerase B